jgi:hypothetical protein
METIKRVQQCNRRHFLGGAGLGLGALALQSLAGSKRALAANLTGANAVSSLATHGTSITPRAKRIIYLFQSGAPSQIEMFDHKPMLQRLAGQELPASVRMGQRLTTMTSGQSSFPLVPSKFAFSRCGSSGAEVSELIPHTGGIVDDLCIVKSMVTEAINHDPAITFCQTGSQLAGRPSIGAWVAYGLGALNRDLPSFVVMLSRAQGRANDQPLYDRLWGSGFLPTSHQGVKLRSGADPVLYLANPAGCSPTLRRDMLDRLATLNKEAHSVSGDPETLTRTEQYELAFRMQTSVPELTDISNEPAHILEMYGPSVHQPGSYARNCLLARRLAERDVRFVQLYHMGWDQHNALPTNLAQQCKDTDQASAALVKDLKQRGLLEDTLVVWGGEFGRTAYSQGPITADSYGRDHHPRCFTVWMAGGGVKPGLFYGETDDFSYNIVDKPVEVFDLNATMLHLLGINHERLTYQFQGRDFRLTDVHGKVVHDLLA